MSANIYVCTLVGLFYFYSILMGIAFEERTTEFSELTQIILCRVLVACVFELNELNSCYFETISYFMFIEIELILFFPLLNIFLGIAYLEAQLLYFFL